MRNLTVEERNGFPFDEDGRHVEATVRELAGLGIGGCCAGPDLFKDLMKLGYGNRRVWGVLNEEELFTGVLAIEGISEDEAVDLEAALSGTDSYLRFDSVHQEWSLWEDE